MTSVYEFIPGSIAALLYVRPPGLTGESIPCIYMSKERGVTVGRHEKPLAEYGWPVEVQTQVNKHFDTVFSLDHENWESEGSSPRARYCDAARPWTAVAPGPTPGYRCVHDRGYKCPICYAQPGEVPYL